MKEMARLNPSGPAVEGSQALANKFNHPRPFGACAGPLALVFHSILCLSLTLHMPREMQTALSPYSHRTVPSHWQAYTSLGFTYQKNSRNYRCPCKIFLNGDAFQLTVSLFITQKDIFFSLNPSEIVMWLWQQWPWCPSHHTVQVTINNETGWSSLVPCLLTYLHSFRSEVESAVAVPTHR